MKNEIIELLLKFEQVNYSRLYKFLAFDKRTEPFSCYSQYIDGSMTLKKKCFPNWIYETICNNTISAWNISDKLLFDILTKEDVK